MRWISDTTDGRIKGIGMDRENRVMQDTSVMDDDTLYRQYLDGDTTAGDELMLRYSDILTAYLNSHLDNMHDAEDLMLETFSVILVDKPRIREGGFRAYLFKIARNKASKLWKKKFRLNEFVLDEDIVSPEAEPEQRLQLDERNETLRRCLNRIAPQYREALWLVYGLGLSYDQAADALRGNRKKVANLLANGKKVLRAELEKEGITVTDLEED